MEEQYNIWKLAKICHDREHTLQWLRDIGMIPTTRYCTKHRKYMTLYDSMYTCGLFKCKKKTVTVILQQLQKTRGLNGTTPQHKHAY
ncbi:unnamed protein product [Euphydryas editha]|uniref:Uncharacterized protein n=1 Tax=Euphydryas editha TaxID=104508 RepID=A0AAU9TEE9_EUPED|nr:unnamed protein product [Euphydryas editha]